MPKTTKVYTYDAPLDSDLDLSITSSADAESPEVSTTEQDRPKLIFVCSKLRGDIKNNQKQACEFARKIVFLGHVPVVPHIYFTSFLKEEDEAERRMGIDAGLVLLEKCDEIWVFAKNGEISEGMAEEIKRAGNLGITIKDGNAELAKFGFCDDRCSLSDDFCVRD